jgi:leucyl aminopeptidase
VPFCRHWPLEIRNLSKYLVSKRNPSTVAIHVVGGEVALKAWLKSQPKLVSNWVAASHFKAGVGEFCLVPGRDGSLQKVIVGIAKRWDPWQLARLPAVLPKGRYELETDLSAEQAGLAALGWALGTYRFDRYKKKPHTFSELVWPKGADAARVAVLAQAMALGRDLINTPAEDMGPLELAAAARAVAEEFGAKVREVVGDVLLKENYPLLHAVGRASTRAPRLVDFCWGDSGHPKVTLVGKGVCFDTGGLDLKPADAMKLMKKDMGGAATVLTIARTVMALGLPVRLRVLIAAVENSVSGNAIRPLDVVKSRKGLTVEIGNTDAEGRLILADALADADDEKPDLLIDIATLTGAARVALGTGLPALFSTSDEAAAELLAAGEHEDDPLWRMPLFKPYRRMLDSKVADLNNIPNGPYAGAIVAALFLQEFVTKSPTWLHIDSMAFNLESHPGRPMGGEVFAARAVIRMLEQRYPHAP